MKRRWILKLAAALLVIVLFLIFSYIIFINTPDKPEYNENNSISITAWNLQIFGDKKANDTQLMQSYVDELSGHDLVIVQEIRDSDGNAFDKFCSMMQAKQDYSCKTSNRAGRTSSKEQYGIIYDNKLFLAGFSEYNTFPQDKWERPPIRADFIIGNYSFSIYTIHTKPEDATSEIQYLEKLISDENSKSNTLVIGDLNADCNYYDEENHDFKSWDWIIQNSDDTTSGNSDCAYDRIIINQNMSNEFISYNIDKSTTSEMSDHYPVSLILQSQDRVQDSKDTSARKFILWLKEQ